MTEKKAEIKPKNTATKKTTKVVSSKKGCPLEYKKKMDVRKVSECPYRQHKLPMPCDRVPGEMVCGTMGCWMIGMILKHYYIDKIPSDEQANFDRLLLLGDYKAFTDWAYIHLMPKQIII